MSERRIELAVLVLCVAAFGAILFAKCETGPSPLRSKVHPRSALSALPKGASIVITIDFGRLKQTTFGELLTNQERKIPGIGSLNDVCGFDPTARVREIAIAVIEDAELEQDVGIAATGDFSVDPIIDCAARIVTRRQGTPARTEIGSFVTLRDRDKPSGEIAVKNGGPVLLGGGAYLREMVDAAEGHVASLATDESHQTLRRTVGTDAEIVASAVAKPGWLERWMGSDLVKASPLAEVRAGALRIKLEPKLEAVVVLACPTEDACKKLAELGEDLKKNLHRDVERWLGADPVRSAEVRVEQNAVRLTVTFDELVAAQVLGRFLSGEERTPPPKEEEPMPEPNEVIRPAPSGR